MTGRPNPKRITLALDAAGMFGPDVDRQLGGEEPMVDQWESGELVPTPHQVRLLATLTGFLPKFFYLEDPPEPSHVFICPPPRERRRETRDRFELRIPAQRTEPVDEKDDGFVSIKRAREVRREVEQETGRPIGAPEPRRDPSGCPRCGLSAGAPCYLPASRCPR